MLTCYRVFCKNYCTRKLQKLSAGIDLSTLKIYYSFGVIAPEMLILIDFIVMTVIYKNLGIS